MKRISVFLVCMLLLVFGMAAAEGNSVVSCINCTVNGEIQWQAKAGETLTAIAAFGAGETLDHWEINGETVTGEANAWLVFQALEGDTTVAAVAAGQAVQPTPAPAVPTAVPEEEQVLTVTAVGCSLRYLNSKGKGEGDPVTEIRFDQPYVNPVTGQQLEGGMVAFEASVEIPRGRKMAYWVIDGVRYDYEGKVRAITVEELTESMVIEAVLEKDAPVTLWIPGENEVVPTPTPTPTPMPGVNPTPSPTPLPVEAVNADLTFAKPVRNGYKSGGKEFDSFDFAEDYTNAATKKVVPGGTIDLKVRAKIPKGKQVDGWWYNKAKLTFDRTPGYFFAVSLHQAMTYEPIFGTKYVTISCTRCTFSGGGYHNAKSGRVPAGTKITVKQNSNFDIWRFIINGKEGHRNQTTFTMTVNNNTKIECTGSKL